MMNQPTTTQFPKTWISKTLKIFNLRSGFYQVTGTNPNPLGAAGKNASFAYLECTSCFGDSGTDIKRRNTGFVAWFCFQCLILFMFFGLVPQTVHAQKDRVIPVLIVDGFSNHDWRQTTRVTKWILEQSGLFSVEVSTIPVDSAERGSWLPPFDQFEVVVQNTNNIQNPSFHWPSQAEEALETYVKNGGGLYVLHSGNNAFPHWNQYDKMIGLGWRPDTVGYALEIDSEENIVRHPPGEGMSTRHGERFNAVIQILNRHPINRGFPDAWQTVNTEVYSFPRGPAEDMTVLSFAYDSTDTRRMWPVEWVIAYGQGRVYNSSMGHLWEGEKYPPAYRCVGYQTTVVRATEWLATGKVTYGVPIDFPSASSPSLRPEEDF